MSYSNCKWCQGRGCLACPGEKKKAEEKEAERRLNKNPLSEDAARFAGLVLDAVNSQESHFGNRVEPVSFTQPNQLRYENGIYRDCPKCRGIGCVSCPEEVDAEYKRQFPDGPKPIATFTYDDLRDPETIAHLRQAIGPEAIIKAYSSGGGGTAEIIENLKERP
jgi:hypothetical protein